MAFHRNKCTNFISLQKISYYKKLQVTWTDFFFYQAMYYT